MGQNYENYGNHGSSSFQDHQGPEASIERSHREKSDLKAMLMAHLYDGGPIAPELRGHLVRPSFQD